MNRPTVTFCCELDENAHGQRGGRSCLEPTFAVRRNANQDVTGWLSTVTCRMSSVRLACDAQTSACVTSCRALRRQERARTRQARTASQRFPPRRPAWCILATLAAAWQYKTDKKTLLAFACLGPTGTGRHPAGCVRVFYDERAGRGTSSRDGVLAPRLRHSLE